jgi:hypothetical protein
MAMKVTLCTFTRTQAETALGPDLPAAVSTALLYYADKLRSGWAPLSPPRFIASDRRRADGEAVEINLAPAVEETLVGEAARHGIDLDALATHSLLVYLAELDFLGAPPCFV